MDLYAITTEEDNIHMVVEVFAKINFSAND